MRVISSNRRSAPGGRDTAYSCLHRALSSGPCRSHKGLTAGSYRDPHICLASPSCVKHPTSSPHHQVPGATQPVLASPLPSLTLSCSSLPPTSVCLPHQKAGSPKTEVPPTLQVLLNTAPKGWLTALTHSLCPTILNWEIMVLKAMYEKDLGRE